MSNTWYDFIWSPMVGCEAGCAHCDIKEIHNEKYEEKIHGKKHPKDYNLPFNCPSFFPDRLEEPFNFVKKDIRSKLATKLSPKAEIVYVCPNGDLFTPSANSDWIQAVIRVCWDNPHLTFAFLTQFPASYLNFKFPKNCWLGTSIDYPVNANRVGRLKLSKANVKFVCVAPIMGDMTPVSFSDIDFVLIGGLDNTEPSQEWINSVRHKKIHHIEKE